MFKITEKIPTKLLLALVFILLASVIFLLRINQKKVDTVSAWWDETWTYRQAINIGWTGSDLTDFQVSFDIGTSALINSGKMQTDCDDIRVTDASGNLIPHWIEENNPGCNAATNTKIWTKLSSLPVGGSTIYIYYGNSSASNVENGNNVFEFFDDFETDSSSDYTITKQVVRGSGPGFIWDTANSQLKSDTSNDCLTIHTDTSLANLYIWSTAVFNGDNDGVGVFIKSSSTYYEALVNSEHPTATDGIFTRTTREPSMVSSSTNSLNCLNQTHEIGIGYDGTSFKMYVDGVLEATYNASVVPTGFGLTSEANVPESTYSNLIARKYTTSDPTSTPQSEEVTPGPIAYWKFDEGVGSTAHDSSGNNQGAITGATWASEDKCISGKCLYFNGSSKVQIPSSTSFNRDTQTIQFWMNLQEDNQWFSVYRPASGGNQWYIYHDNANYARLKWYNNSTVHNLWSYKAPGTNQWHQFTAVMTPDLQIMYADGLEVSRTTIALSLTATDGDIILGEYGSPGSYSLVGFLDEVKIYPYARTASQIKADYAAGLAGMGGNSSVNIGGDSTGKSLSDGLVGYWTMDEGVGTTTLDKSGNNNTGTFGTGDSAPGWSTGKYGIGISFDGNDYANTSIGVSSTNFAVSLWMKADSSGEQYDTVISIGPNTNGENALQKTLGSGQTDAYMDFEDGSNNHNQINLGTLFDNNWHHIVYQNNGQPGGARVYKNGQLIGSTTQNTSYTITEIVIGARVLLHTQNYNGLIDEVRIYNRALSASEVQTLYNYAPDPIAHWKMDENSGSVVNDSSGNSNNGTWGGTGTHWTVGKFGSGGVFNGNSDYINAGTAPEFNFTGNHTISAWIKSTHTATNIVAVGKYSGSGDNYWFGLITGKATYFGAVDTTQTASDGNWHYMTGTCNDEISSIYLDGILKDTGICSTPISPGGFLGIGKFGSGENYWWNGLIDDVKIYNYARTPKQILEDMNARSDAQKSTLPIAHWNFDEGYGTTANDKVGGNTATFGTGSSAPTWTNNGKVGKALSFGGNDYFTISQPSIQTSPNLFTVSGYINPTNHTSFFITPQSNGIDQDIGYDGTNGRLYIRIAEAGDTNERTRYSSVNSVPINNWTHWVVSINDKNIKIFINGKLDSEYNEVINIGGWTNTWYIGQRGNNSYFLNGFLDEVKIYNYALSADEVKQDFNQGKSMVMGQSSSNTGSTAPAGSASQEYCVPGSTDPCSPPVAEWNFEENVGTTAYDTSGNGNHGVFATGSAAPSWSMGHNNTGAGLQFDGNDYATITDSSALKPTTAITAQAWFKSTNISAQQKIISKTEASGYQLSINENSACPTNTLCFVLNISGTYYSASYASSNLSNNTWYHVSGSYDGSTVKLFLNSSQVGTTATISGSITQSTPPLCIGSEASGVACNVNQYFQGQIDQVRIYNYARTPAQVAWDYNRGKPVGWWKLDETSGAVTHDSSGNINHGTLGTGSSSPTWITGKLNNAASLDGNDYISVADPGTNSIFDQVNEVTLSTWINPNTMPQATNAGISGKGNNYFLLFPDGTEIRAYFWNGSTYGSIVTTNAGITTGSWYNIIMVYKPGYYKIYVNGEEKAVSTSITDVMLPDNSPIYIGSDRGSANRYFSGLIDDVRIYNYALTGKQIQTLYNSGAVSFN